MPRIQIASEVDRLLLKQANLYRLQSRVDELIRGIAHGAPFSLTPPLVKSLHAIAMQGLLTNAGEYRSDGVCLTNSPHVPPPAFDVDAHVEGLCRYVNEHWQSRDLVHLCAFVMWRLNWIHPFENGNGRTSRAVSYLVLCAKYGNLLPATNSVIRQILSNKQPYYSALRECDILHDQQGGQFGPLPPLENLVAYLLKEQLRAAL